MNIKNQVSHLLVRWIRAVASGDVEQVVACYAPDALLLPTVSPRLRHNHAEIRDYFIHFLSKKPTGRIEEENIRIFGEIAVNSGLYTFLMMEDGQPKEVAARFTFVYRKTDGTWRIIAHHSSVVPA